MDEMTSLIDIFENSREVIFSIVTILIAYLIIKYICRYILYSSGKSNSRYPKIKISIAILLGQVYWILFHLINVENNYVIINIIVGILSAKLCGRWSLLSGATTVPVYIICLIIFGIIAPSSESSQAWEALLFIPITLVLLFTTYIFFQIFEARAEARANEN
jgi:hypothetical protein